MMPAASQCTLRLPRGFCAATLEVPKPILRAVMMGRAARAGAREMAGERMREGKDEHRRRKIEADMSIKHELTLEGSPPAEMRATVTAVRVRAASELARELDPVPKSPVPLLVSSCEPSNARLVADADEKANASAYLSL